MEKSLKMEKVLKKKKLKMPTAYTVLFLIIAVIAILTWIVPAGKYSYVASNSSVLQPIPGSYERIAQNPQGLWEIFNAPIKGFFNGMDIELFILVIGGFLGVVMKTGAIDAGIGQVVKKLKGKEAYMIPILMIIFSLGGTTYGMCEETIAFYPLIITVFLAAGYDTITAVSVIALGAGIGCIGSTVNPFATGIASGFAGISVGVGIFTRVLMLVICNVIGILFVMNYAKKVKKNPECSLVADMREDNLKHFLGNIHNQDVVTLDKKRKNILIAFGITFIIMIFSVIPWSNKFGITIFEDINNFFINMPILGGIIGRVIPLGDWWFGELAILFLVSSIIIGIFVYKMEEKEFMDTFIAGAMDLLGVAIIIGVSRGIAVVMNDGGMTATVLNIGEKSLTSLGKLPFVILTYIFYIPLSFLVPSSSGLATLSMPIMAPLADFVGIGRELVVTSYQAASGVVNLITPTSGVIMGALALARIPYDIYLKHVIKLIGILFVVNMAIIGISALF